MVGEDKIAAIGIRVAPLGLVSRHLVQRRAGSPHFGGIVPCGVSQHGVTCLVDLGLPVTMPEADSVPARVFERVFGPTGVYLFIFAA